MRVWLYQLAHDVRSAWIQLLVAVLFVVNGDPTTAYVWLGLTLAWNAERDDMTRDERKGIYKTPLMQIMVWVLTPIMLLRTLQDW